MQRKTRFNWKLLALSLVVAVIAAFTACSSPTGGGEDYSGVTVATYTVRFWHEKEEYPEYAMRSVPNDSKISEPSLIPGVDDHVFIGWYKENGYQSEWIFDIDTVKRNTDLYALFVHKNDKVSVTFDINNPDYTESAPEAQTIGKYQMATKPNPEPQHVDYEFNGWFKKGATIPWDFSNRVTEDITLEAKWKRHITHTVKFWDDATEYEALRIEKAREGFPISAPSEPKKGGEIFVGWYKESGFNTEWIFATEKVTGETNLFAHFSQVNDKVTVQFELNDGGDTENPAIYSFDDALLNQSITRYTIAEKPTPNPTRDKYGFRGWFVKNGSVPQNNDTEWNFSDRVRNNLTLYAKWIEPHTVNFDANGGTFEDPDSMGKPQRVKHGENAKSPGNIDREKHSFDGWWTRNGNNWVKKWDFGNDFVLGDMTLTAKWVQEHEVRFNPNGGDFKTGDSPAAERTQTVKNGSMVTEPELAPNEFGLVGWYTNNGTVSGGWGSRWEFDKHTVTKDMTLTARWLPIHTVIFLDDDKDGNDSVTKRILSNTKIVEPTNFLKGDKKPVGWYWDSAHRNKYDFNKPVLSNLILHAKWPSQYEVTFITGKSGADAIKTVKVWEGESVNKDNKGNVPEPGAQNKFLYWVDEANPAMKWDLDMTPVMKDTRLRPKWGQFQVGDKGPGDGYIFHAPEGGFTLYLDANDTVGVQAYYLELAPHNVPTGRLKWYVDGNVTGANVAAVSNATSQNTVGYGRKNTSIILNSVTDRAKAEAANQASKYDDSGTWFLPNVGEFKLLAAAVHNYFDLDHSASDDYWLSNQTSATSNSGILGAFNSNSTANIKMYVEKNKPNFVRPIRAW
ncbi:MAG: InlB B-repeat-containing protein [Treponema sp.]|nr:InlB B-repeat-containing protein [Treponema sp.]